MKSLLFGLVMLLFIPSAAFALSDPQVEVEKVVNTVLAVLKNKDISLADKKARISTQVQDFLDVESMSRRTLGSYWDSASVEQRQHFERLFVKVMEGTYLNKVDDYSSGSVLFVKKRVKDDKAIIDTVIKSNDLEIPVQYRLIYGTDRWQVFDLVIDGVSLIKNYSSTYSEIIRRDGYDGLFALMEKKVLEMAAQ